MAVNQKVTVIVVPFPSQGSVSPLLDLSRRVAAYGVPAYYVGPEDSILQAKARSDGSCPSPAANLHFHSFAATLFPDPEQKIKRTLLLFQFPLSALVEKLARENDRVVIIFDSLMASTIEPVDSSPNVEFYAFESCSCFNACSAISEVIGKPQLPPEAGEIMKHKIWPGVQPSTEMRKFINMQYDFGCRKFRSGTIFNSNRIIEGSYLDLLEESKQLDPHKIWALGPFNPVSTHRKLDAKWFKWLDTQAERSIMFVIISSTLSVEQMNEIALGLERSKVKFLWVLRDDQLPKALKRGLNRAGFVVSEFVPQREILNHRAVGGFLSNCRWESCMESISTGVAMVAWPMNCGQVRNKHLITTGLKIGVEVDSAWSDKIVSSSAVEKAVKRLMASEEGDKMRQKAAKLGDLLKQSVMEGGANKVEMDSFMAHITRKD